MEIGDFFQENFKTEVKSHEVTGCGQPHISRCQAGWNSNYSVASPSLRRGLYLVSGND